MTQKQQELAEKRAVKAAARRGLLTKTEIGRLTASRPTPAKLEPIEMPQKEAIMAAFEKVHGACALCHGKNPFCERLGCHTKPNGESGYDPKFGGGETQRVIEAARRLARERVTHKAMPEEVKRNLRALAATRKAAIETDAPVDASEKKSKPKAALKNTIEPHVDELAAGTAAEIIGGPRTGQHCVVLSYSWFKKTILYAKVRLTAGKVSVSVRATLLKAV